MLYPQRNTIIAASALSLIAVFSGWYIHHTASVSANGKPTLNPTQEHQRKNHSTDRYPTDEKRAARLIELARLKKLWLEIQDEAKRDFHADDFHALAQETSELLLCSRESIRLLEFLDSRDLFYSSFQIREQIDALFLSHLAPEARILLVELSKQDNLDIYDILTHWGYVAGRSCSEEELDNFCDSLGDRSLALCASLGWNTQLAKTEPVMAIVSALQLLNSEVPNHMSSQVLFSLIDNIPDDFDLREIEMLLPPDTDQTSSDVRERLLTKWASLDPAAAANHVMEHPDRVSPDALQVIVESVLKNDSNGGVEWVKTFPPGPYFDAAAETAVFYVIHFDSAEATRLTSMIQNPEIREKCAKRVEREKHIDYNKREQ